MTLNYENNLLFTGSEDGSISFMALVDLDRRPKMQRTPVNHTSEVIVQGRLRNRLLHEIKVKTAELEEKKSESMTKLKLMKQNYTNQLKELKNLMQSEEEQGNDKMA